MLHRGGPCARESTPKHRTRSRIAAMSGPFPLYDSTALRQAEARAASRLGDDFVLMQRAGLAAWHCVLAHWPQAQRIAVACGPGNNGGDGYVQIGRAPVCTPVTNAPLVCRLLLAKQKNT